MGAKNSVSKQDLEPPNTAPVRRHLYEEIDEVLLVKHQALNRQISSSTGTCNVETHLPLAAQTDDSQALQPKSKSKSLPDVLAVSASESVKAVDYCPEVNKRIHPYDEIQLGQPPCSQSSVNENEVKQKDKLKDKTGKKKNKKKENAKVCTEISDKDDNSKVKKNFKEKPDKKKQQELSAVGESVSLETTSKLNIAPSNMKAALRGHTYEEITDEQLSLNQGTKKPDKLDKVNKNKDPKGKAGKESPITRSESSLIDNQFASNTRFLSTTGSENPQTPTRYHPYDEITEQGLDSNRQMKHDNENKLKKQNSEKNEKRIQAAHDIPDTEYLNVGAIQGAFVHSLVGESFSKEQSEEKDDALTDVYAVPQKKHLKHVGESFSKEQSEEKDDALTDVYPVPQKKHLKTKELNYIEVELNTAAPKVEVKSQYSPTAYTNVISKDGKFLLLES